VKAAENAGLDLAHVPLEIMRKIEPRIDASVFEVLQVGKSVESRRSFGGTAPQNVRAAAEIWLKSLESEKASG
jgi:argininosuccinate lyase